MVDFGSDVFSQMARLDMTPSVNSWNSIARFFEKAKLLDAVVASAKMGNERVMQDKTTPFPLRKVQPEKIQKTNIRNTAIRS